MPKIAIVTTDAPAPVASYSQAVLKGDTLQVAGQGPVNPETGQFAGTTIATQTRQVMRNIQAILRAANSDFDDVMMMRVYLTDTSHFAEMNEVYSEFVTAPFPARTTVFVTLPPGMLVEIDALAILGD